MSVVQTSGQSDVFKAMGWRLEVAQAFPQVISHCQMKLGLEGTAIQRQLKKREGGVFKK